MKVLAVDIGTGTQDILLYDSRLDVENGFKLILPSPTMIIHRRIQAATRARRPILLTGRQMGGGPSAWAAADHARAGIPTYATPQAATTIDDEPARVEQLGIRILSVDEAGKLPDPVEHIEMRDFDFEAIAAAFERFGLSLRDLDAVAVAVFDHGAAPAGVSDRKFRFDYLDRRIRERNALSSFAYSSGAAPPEMSRLQAVTEVAGSLDCPLVVMDTAPAAVLGATFDPRVAQPARKLIANIGNFHTLAFRLGPDGIEGLFEHHTGEIDRLKLESLLVHLADGSLQNEDVFNDMGHGALIYSHQPFETGRADFDVVITGPRRSMFLEPFTAASRPLRPYFAVPFGDMMISGCFGLLSATADILPELAGPIKRSLQAAGPHGVAPWDID